jgi:hypothetical protein
MVASLPGRTRRDAGGVGVIAFNVANELLITHRPRDNSLFEGAGSRAVRAHASCGG